VGYSARVLRKISTIGYTAALATAPAWMTACSAPPDAQSSEPTVLFSLTSDAMHFENPSGMDVTLVMEGVDPRAVWFTDRPVRDSGAITTERLAAEWDEGASFQADPPNAALVLHEPVKVGDTVTDTMVAEIRDASYDPESATFTADLRVLSDEATDVEGNLAEHGRNHDVAWPDRAGAASLFIDSITLCTNPSTCNGKTTNYTVNSTIYFTTTITETVTMAPVSWSQESGERL
jgi:hypothetical protein